MGAFRDKVEADRKKYVEEQTEKNRKERDDRREEAYLEFVGLFEVEPDGRSDEVNNEFYVDGLSLRIIRVRQDGWLEYPEGDAEGRKRMIGYARYLGECPDCGQECWSQKVFVSTGNLSALGIVLGREFRPWVAQYNENAHDCPAAKKKPKVNVHKQRLEAIAEAVGEQLLEMEYIPES